MPPPVLPRPILIKSHPDLQDLIQTLSDQPVIAVDTEANSLFAYKEKVCLIQFSIPGSDYLLDPLTIKDLSQLNNVFNTPKIEKVFHAAEYDILILKHDFHFKFEALFDTMLAARILGWHSVGLNSILKSQFGIKVYKKYQRADWGKRPISKEMLSYAQIDTHYLIPLRNRMKASLIEKERWELAKEDFQRLRWVKSNGSQKKRRDIWRINGARDLRSHQTAVLNQLIKYRDEKARVLDRPLFKVIGDQSLVNLAVAKPATLGELAAVPGISPKQVKWLGKGLLKAVHRGLKSPPPPKPQRSKYNPDYILRVDSLKNWRKNTARIMGVESDVILPRDLLYELAKNNPQDKDALNRILFSVPWRAKTFGDEIFRVLTSS
jgi:ribonuclease D